ncbi:uncharacterized protein PG986_010171 [Apiospora aurea]|uniref:F-box domain-containing protein n=1 Tax=Apiospora aurea TaxID=335848 RepID=A0ABR1QA18_9PEZI
MERSQSRGCLFESLPTELLLKVLSGLPDLTSLDSVLHASPTTHRIFDEYAVEVAEAILACDYNILLSYHRHPWRTDDVHHGPHPIESGVTCAYVRVMFYMMAAIRSSRFPINSLTEFRQNVVDPFCLIATYRRLNWPSLECLKSYLARLESICPSRPAIGKKAFWKGRRAGTVQNNAEGLDQVPGQPVVVRDAGPPSWVEEQRATRAFWRLQFVCGMQRSARSALLPAAWPPEDVEQLRNYSRAQLLSLYSLPHSHGGYGHARHHPEIHEIYSAAQYLETAHHGCRWPDEAVVPPQVSRSGGESGYQALDGGEAGARAVVLDR